MLKGLNESIMSFIVKDDNGNKDEEIDKIRFEIKRAEEDLVRVRCKLDFISASCQVDDLVDSYIYEMKAIEMRRCYWIKKIKEIEK